MVWLITPILSGIVSALFIWIIEKMILKAKDTLEAGLTFLPFFYFFTIFVNIFSITYEGSELLGMQNFGWSMATIIATSVAVVSSILCRIFLVPWQRRKIENLIASPNQQRNSSKYWNLTSNYLVLCVFSSFTIFRGNLCTRSCVTFVYIFTSISGSL